MLEGLQLTAAVFSWRHLLFIFTWLIILFLLPSVHPVWSSSPFVHHQSNLSPGARRLQPSTPPPQVARIQLCLKLVPPLPFLLLVRWHLHRPVPVLLLQQPIRHRHKRHQSEDHLCLHALNLDTLCTTAMWYTCTCTHTQRYKFWLRF